MLNTEKRNPASMHIDRMTTEEMLRVMQDENRNAVEAVNEVLPEIGKAVDAIVASFENGGRLFYIGAGTSGRLAVVDASECPPTFGVEPELVTAIIAGGVKCMTSASENEEDRGENGIADLKAKGVCGKDVVVGLSASGGAAYVVEALRYAESLGCVTVGVCCNRDTKLEKASQIAICPDTGPEVVTGSTRMKAGTAQKLILNMLSTAAMIKTGKVYENLMINLKPVNEKLERRCVRILQEITGADEAAAENALKQAEGNLRNAIAILKQE